MLNSLPSLAYVAIYPYLCSADRSSKAPIVGGCGRDVDNILKKGVYSTLFLDA